MNKLTKEEQEHVTLYITFDNLQKRYRVGGE
jgi:hypothetical protein